MSTYIPVLVTQETQILNIEVSYGQIIEADTEWLCRSLRTSPSMCLVSMEWIRSRVFFDQGVGVLHQITVNQVA